jgi:hypothetical protein
LRALRAPLIGCVAWLVPIRVSHFWSWLRAVAVLIIASLRNGAGNANVDHGGNRARSELRFISAW